MNKLKLIFSSAIASMASAGFVVIATILGEKYKPFKDWLASVSGHHWVTKGILSLLLYAATVALVYFSVKEVDGAKVAKAVMVLIYAVIAGMLSIFLFYTMHYLGIA